MISGSLSVKIKHKVDTLENWMNFEDIIEEGKIIGVKENDTIKLKIGNGINYFADLPYITGDIKSDDPEEQDSIITNRKYEYSDIEILTTNDDIIPSGQLIIVKDGDEVKFKVGDGVTSFNNLPYITNKIENITNVTNNYVNHTVKSLNAWTIENKVIDKDEIIVVKDNDTVKLKLGDGVSHFNDLPYITTEFNIDIDQTPITKYDTESNWITEDPIPREGEIITSKVDNEIRLKVGDGINRFSDLPYISATNTILTNILNGTETLIFDCGDSNS